MQFKNYSTLQGLHAYLGASKYHWLNYDDDKLVQTYKNHMAKQKGTELHEFAERAIKLKQKLARSTKTLNMYINDAIGFNMTPEVILYYSENCFGTVDAISFKNNFLRIHDLKTGVGPVSFSQLEIYVALFCLDYAVNPNTIEWELRIYQNDAYTIHVPEKEVILYIMEKIKSSDKIIKKLQQEG